MPKTIRDMLTTVGRHGNPWDASSTKRFAWLKRLQAKDISQGETADLCYYVGSVAAGDERNQAVAMAMARVLTAARVDFGVLGREEPYSGDDVRRLGEDGLFEAMVEGSYEAFKQSGVSNLVTTSPHSLFTISHEYPQLKDEAEG